MPTADAGFANQVRRAWSGEWSPADVLQAAHDLSEAGQPVLAAVLYRTWIDRHTEAPSPVLLFNLGVLLFSQQDYAGASAAYARALQQAPAFLQPRFNLGLTYERLGDSPAATAQWLWIDSHASSDDPEQRPFVLLALNNLGRHCEDQARYAEALAYLTRSLRIEPAQPDVVQHWVFLRARQCVWPVYEPLAGLDIDEQRAHTSALAMIGLSEDPQHQLAAARNYVRRKVKVDVPRLAPSHGYAHRKLRIAYCSSDFCLHPVAMLTAELFELHDRERFEVFGFDWSRDDGSALRKRVISAMDHFKCIHALDDEQAARLIRSHEIDILVDLQGQTLGARPNMLAFRPAPIQVTYLGLPATTGLPFIDYVIADRFLIPPDAQPYYSEQPLYLPDIYQASDRQRENGPLPTRVDCGLPADGFVFCTFNNNYKFTPEMFGAWMRILQRVPGSVLWLLADNPWAHANLAREALARGIGPERLVFAPRALPAAYLARYAVADLFLDAYPFNGGTTVNDALWMGLPVLTRTGRTFASRMAGALLTAAGLPQLICADLRDYEDKAVALAHDGPALARMRAHLRAVRRDGALFDTPRFVRHLEAQFMELCKGRTGQRDIGTEMPVEGRVLPASPGLQRVAN